MSKFEKLLHRFLEKPTDFTWQELTTLLYRLGYIGLPGAGSRAKFVHVHYAPIILHKPHPKPIMKRYQIEQIIHQLKNEGIL